MDSIGDIATVTVHIKKIKKRLNLIQASHSILKQYGVLATDLSYNQLMGAVRMDNSLRYVRSINHKYHISIS